MVSKKAIIVFICAVVMLGATLTYASIQKNSVLDKVCAANKTQNETFTKLLINARNVSYQAIEKNETNQTVVEIEAFFNPTIEELELNDC